MQFHTMVLLYRYQLVFIVNQLMCFHAAADSTLFDIGRNKCFDNHLGCTIATSESWNEQLNTDQAFIGIVSIEFHAKKAPFHIVGNPLRCCTRPNRKRQGNNTCDFGLCLNQESIVCNTVPCWVSTPAF